MIDKEELLPVDFIKQQKLYAKGGMYDTKGNPNQPAIQQPQPPPPKPPKPPSTTKKENAKKLKSVQKKQTRRRQRRRTRQHCQHASFMMPMATLLLHNETICSSAHIPMKSNIRAIHNQSINILYGRMSFDPSLDYQLV